MTRVKINEHPNFLADVPNEKTRVIKVNDSMKPNEPLKISLMLKGVKGYLAHRRPRAS